MEDLGWLVGAADGSDDFVGDEDLFPEFVPAPEAINSQILRIVTRSQWNT